MGAGGEIFVLDMGEPVKMIDLAREYIRLSGHREPDISIEFIGLRPGERLHEEPVTDHESTSPTAHPRLRIAKSGPALDAAWMEEIFVWLQQGNPEAEQLRHELAAHAPGYMALTSAPVAASEGPAAPQPG